MFTNSRGLAFSSQNLSKQNLAYQVINPENPNGPINPIYRWYTSPTSQNHTTLITDRRIYRPGQTVYYKGIGWKATLDTLYALEGQKYKISFKDANDKEIAQQEVTSNRYGSQEVSSFRPASLTDILPSIPKKVRLPSRLRITNDLNSKSPFTNRHEPILSVISSGWKDRSEAFPA